MPEIIEADTDGSYFTWNADWDEDQFESDINEFIAEVVETWSVPLDTRKEWGIKGPDGGDPIVEMEMEVNTYDKGYWYKMKTYLLIEDCLHCKGDPDCTSCEGWGTTLKFTGGSWKDRRNPILFDTVRDQLGRMRMNDAPRTDVIQVIAKAMRIEEYPLSDLTTSVSPSKEIKHYKKEPWFVKVMLRAERLLGWPPRPHFRYEFIYAHNEDGVELSAIATKKDINYFRYREMIAGIADRFGYGEYAWDWVTVPPLFEILELPSY